MDDHLGCPMDRRDEVNVFRFGCPMDIGGGVEQCHFGCLADRWRHHEKKET